MYAKLIGFACLLWGILWMLWPTLLRGKMLRNTGRYLFFSALAYLFPLMHFFGVKGIIPSVAAVAGVWTLMALMSPLLRRFFEKIPLVAFRAAGFTHMTLGAILVWWPKK